MGGKSSRESTDLSRIICQLECIGYVHSFYAQEARVPVVFVAPHLHTSQMCNNTKLRYTQPALTYVEQVLVVLELSLEFYGDV